MLPILDLYIMKIPMYSFISIIGLVVAGLIFCIRIYRAGHDENDAIIFLLFIAVGMVIGGKILYGIVNIKYIKGLAAADSFKDVLGVLNNVFGGLVFYGGLIGAGLSGLFYIKIKKGKLPKDLYLDNAALFAPIFHAFARVGCFFGGCCYGIESDFGFAVPDSVTPVTPHIGHVSRFPVQLLESLCNVGIAILIYVLMKKGIMKGKLAFVYLGVYAIVRFSDEFLRGDEVRGFVGPLSTSQFISLFIAAFAAFMLFVLPRIKKVPAETVAPDLENSSSVQ